ncbi:MAG: recombinase family protein [Fimbriimonadaceae bacterium]|nr:recombinase family protein [Alphaproteobacteria bacterium]
MKTAAVQPVRCAVYTRVSTDQGLDQDFNSLDAQRDAAEAYVRSQAHAGWILVRTRYDDGGYSGGSTDRPALQRLLSDVGEKKIGVIVVYKVDRLTRSLADFAKLIELFDGQGVSFVSVTQQFNTTTSMGRLTLNVLLSFAQFEREVTSERIRDKIAASKRKGLWVGGMVPLGYEVKKRKVFLIKNEAERVRTIFRHYLKLGSLDRLMVDLRKKGIRSKVRHLATGRTIGGIPFTRGPLAHLLRNRFYIGEVLYKGEICPGEQPAILDRALFDAVQAKLVKQRTRHTVLRQASDSILIGRIFDDRGNRMTPSHSRKDGRRHRYYISAALVHGQADRAGSVRRVPAIEVEKVIAETIREHFGEPNSVDDRDIITRHLLRVEVQADQLAVELRVASKTGAVRGGKMNQSDEHGAETTLVSIPWRKTPSKRQREIIAPAPSSATHHDLRPIRSETRATLIKSIACGRRWLDELVTGAVINAEAIADREKCSVRHVNMTISLAFLAPRLVTAAVKGHLPRGIGVARLRDAPAEWSRQSKMLGLSF